MKTCSESGITCQFVITDVFIFQWSLEALRQITAAYKIHNNLFKTGTE